jgi:hypothetical protein
MTELTNCLWFDNQGEEAANFSSVSSRIRASVMHALQRG